MNTKNSRSSSRRGTDATPPPLTPIRVSSGRHPFELTFLLGGLVCGIMMILLDALPRSLVLAMPATVEWSWETGLIVAGLVGLAGVGWPGQLSTGLGLELGAVLLLGANTAMYAIALFSMSGMAALTAGTFIGAVSIGSSWRCAQIIGDLRRLARASLANAPTRAGTP
ncbi:hypothetical protein ACIBF5_22330 [Micromonospora sp. NPDC050417]|uniref:hypothetical protein n=1 Tax=Micromonospora sp. NPDC050417 TaxID=3364280 RepID=UPI0037A819E2